MQATVVSESSGFRRSALEAEIAESANPPLLAAVVALGDLIGKINRDEAAARLKVLGAIADSPQLGRDVAAELGIDPSTVSRHLAALSREGLITHHDDLGDRRARPVMATDSGRKMYVDDLHARISRIDGAISGWSVEERDQLSTLLARLVHDIERQRNALERTAR